MKRTLPFLIALALAFSGCLGLFPDGVDTDEEPNENEGDAPDPNEDGADGNETGEGPAEGGDGNETTDPVPVTASLAANRTSGTAPLNVTFTVDGSGADDAELTWTLDFGDGSDPASGDTFPAEVEHAYEEGNHTAVLTVTDGETPATDEIGLTVEAPAAGGPNPEQSGTSGLCLDYNVLYLVDGVAEPGTTTVEVAPGTQYVGSAGDYVFYIDFFDEDGVSVDYGGAEGEVPAGSAYGVVCASAVDNYPAVPVPATAWTYQDGF